MCHSRRFVTILLPLSAATCLSIIALLSSCGGSSSSSSSSTTSTTTATTTNAYALAYQSATYNNGTGGNLTVSFPSSCSMTVSGTGVPYQHQVYYLAPTSTGGTTVVTTPNGKIQLQLMAYAGTGLSTNVATVSGTFNICPTKASSTTATGNGPIGLIFSGTVLFDAYEATTTVALADNVSYTFNSTACGGTTCTAYFIDPCNQHTAGGTSGSTWHYHGVPTCWTSKVDGASGPSHIIGIALDGYPIYGGYDINGNAVSAASLDACNGITSATPEFPSGAYHYVLPVNTTTAQSSINCYTGTVDATLAQLMKKLSCNMPMLLANGKMRLPDGREVSREEASVWMKQTMPGMQMAGNIPSVAPQPATGPKKKDAAKDGKPMAAMTGMM